MIITCSTVAQSTPAQVTREIADRLAEVPAVKGTPVSDETAQAIAARHASIVGPRGAFAALATTGRVDPDALTAEIATVAQAVGSDTDAMITLVALLGWTLQRRQG